MVAKLTSLTHKIAIQLHSGREMFHLQFSLQVASPETFGYTLVFVASFHEERGALYVSLTDPSTTFEPTERFS